jgi:hypothetical protein
VSGSSSIPLITHAEASPLFFLSLTAEAQRCIGCNSLDFADRDKNVDLSNSLYIFLQNIRGLRSKSVELIHSFEIDNLKPHILCLSELAWKNRT